MQKGILWLLAIGATMSLAWREQRVVPSSSSGEREATLATAEIDIDQSRSPAIEVVTSEATAVPSDVGDTPLPNSVRAHLARTGESVADYHAFLAAERAYEERKERALTTGILDTRTFVLDRGKATRWFERTIAPRCAQNILERSRGDAHQRVDRMFADMSHLLAQWYGGAARSSDPSSTYRLATQAIEARTRELDIVDSLLRPVLDQARIDLDTLLGRATDGRPWF